MTNQNEYAALMLYHAEKVVALLKTNATHNPAAHSGVATLTSCPGCELIARAKRLFQMAQAEDQTASGRRNGGKSNRDRIFEEVRTLLRTEEPSASPGLRP
jgi:hypothetical protein